MSRVVGLGWAKSLLRQIVGRIRAFMNTNRITIRMSVAGFCIPSAIGLFIYVAQSHEDIGAFVYWGIVVIIAVMFIIALWAWASAIRLADQEVAREKSLTGEIHNLVEELHNLIEEMKK